MRMGPVPDCLKAMGCVKITREEMAENVAERKAAYIKKQKEKAGDAPKVVYKYNPNKDVRYTNE